MNARDAPCEKKLKTWQKKLSKLMKIMQNENTKKNQQAHEKCETFEKTAVWGKSTKAAHHPVDLGGGSPGPGAVQLPHPLPGLRAPLVRLLQLVFLDPLQQRRFATPTVLGMMNALH